MFVVTLSLVSGAPQYLEDTPEVAEAKAVFKAAYEAALAGDHAALAPVNNDVQAEQIPEAFIDDDKDVAAAKAAFQAVFDDVAAGGLAAKQAPAPEAPFPPSATITYQPLPYPFYSPFHPYYAGYNPYNYLPAFGLPYHHGVPIIV